MRTKAQRGRDRMARNYGVKGGEADRVRAMECIVATAADETGQPHAQLLEHGWTACGGLAGAHHAEPRQMGGAGEGRMRLFSACARHGAQAGEGSKLGKVSSQRLKFERLYGVDVGATADAIALSHEPPLGVRGLAERWAAERTLANMDPELCPEIEERAAALVRPLGVLVGYDLAALLGWVRRSSASTIYAQREKDSDWGRAHPTSDDDKHDAIADVAHELGLVDAQGYPLHCVDALCELAGWPS